MMSRRLTVAIAAVAVLGASTSAVAAKKGADDLRIVGQLKFKPGKSVTDNQRFQSRTVSVRSGGTVDFVNKAKTQDPHTISIVRKLPKGFDCGECGAIEESHDLDPETGEPRRPEVDSDGDGGFNTAGDSIVVAPPGAPGSKGELKITAPAGETLKALCIIHPWMQAKIRVR